MTAFGVAAVSLMAISYSLERRHRRFTVLFAAACGLSSIYGFLIAASRSASSKHCGAFLRSNGFATRETLGTRVEPALAAVG
jgi:hypothetical protein